MDQKTIANLNPNELDWLLDSLIHSFPTSSLHIGHPSVVRQEQPTQQEYVHASLWYDKDLEEFTVSNFLTDSPICLLKNMLISGEYLAEQDSVVYLLDEQQVCENVIMMSIYYQIIDSINRYNIRWLLDYYINNNRAISVYTYIRICT